MSKFKLSQWHAFNVKPVHVGIYEFEAIAQQKWFRMWDGKSWLWGGSTINAAMHPKAAPVILLQDEKWRGIVK